MGKRDGEKRAKTAGSLRAVPFARSRTIEALTRTRWGAAAYDSHVVRRCHELVKVRVDELAVEDLRLLIGQRIALPFLVPEALNHLRASPLASGDLYPGDLLASVLKVEPHFWKVNPSLRDALVAIVDRIDEVPSVLRESLAAFRAR